MITFTRDKRFGQVDTVQRKTEDDTTIGRIWEASNTFLTTIQRDFFPWPRCIHEQDPKIEFFPYIDKPSVSELIESMLTAEWLSGAEEMPCRLARSESRYSLLAWTSCRCSALACYIMHARNLTISDNTVSRERHGRWACTRFSLFFSLSACVASGCRVSAH